MSVIRICSTSRTFGQGSTHVLVSGESIDIVRRTNADFWSLGRDMRKRVGKKRYARSGKVDT
ncbi:hypothetical protein BDV38DRAFT_241652 [Aspergillus pseudotamarii]|uniref:Uncharacterized protein n=1 Tax=Aspergillus pseudotamarii TaxID=132259 RepID=A0A5N6T0A1_ASPPS|nr:uncharacterized protein BDV38DRAFT_241652 [Aspergillus pseudotamarii]KAE8139521.1 hypothetical protein BDV38DRAFT_241652 [Aspergillus pseudotamarii]